MLRVVFVILTLLSYAGNSIASSKLLASEFTESAFDLKAEKSALNDRTWLLGIEAGATMTSGNTDTQTFKAKVTGALFRSFWRLNYFGQLLKKTDNGQQKVSKWKVGTKANWDFSEINSSFATLEYEEDQFASYGSLATVAAGYTHRFYQQNNIMWDADIGPGLRWTTRESGLTDQELSSEVLTVIHLGTNFMFPLSKHAEFAQVLVSDFGLAGDQSTVIRSESAVTASVFDNLKMKLSYTLRHDTLPADNKEKLDTQTSVTLLMTF